MIVATGDCDGRLNLFRYPSVEKEAQFKVNVGHAGPISNCKFLFDDTHLISIGEDD